MKKNELNSNNPLNLVNNIYKFIKGRRAELLLVELPTVNELTEKTELQKLSSMMCTDLVYKDLSSKNNECEMFFDGYSKKVFRKVIEANKDLYEKCFNTFTAEYLDKICACDPNLVQNNNYFCMADYESELMNIKDGVRETANQIEDNLHNIFVFGNSTTFGYYTADDETIASYLQEYVAPYKYNVHNYATVNDTLLNIYNRVINTGICDNDIVVIGIPKGFLGNSVFLFPHIDTTEGFYTHTEKENLIDRAHLTAYGNSWIAEMIFHGLEKDMTFFDTNDETIESQVEVLIEDFKKEHELFADDLQIGASVMSCNPFTSGHRYLVELGSRMFDYFVVFLMQEGMNLVFDKEECENLVRVGVQDLDNVIVVPMSDVFSYQTFWPEYNDIMLRHSKNYVGLNTYNLLNVVGKAFKQLNVKHFLCGIETDDNITRQHIVQAKTVFPQNDINVICIPRKQMKDNKLSISGTECRRMLAEGEYDKLNGFLQPQVIDYIKEKKLQIQTPKFPTKMAVEFFDRESYRTLKKYKNNLGLLIVDKEDCLKNIMALRKITKGCSKDELLSIIQMNIKTSVWAGYLYLMNVEMDEGLYAIIMNELKDDEYKQKLRGKHDGVAN